MDMKNVFNLMTTMAMCSTGGFSNEKAQELAVKCFGSADEYEKAFDIVCQQWDNIPDNTLEEWFFSKLEEDFKAIKADLEADALKEKENAS